jgi:hypothetical protein
MSKLLMNNQQEGFNGGERYDCLRNIPPQLTVNLQEGISSGDSGIGGSPRRQDQDGESCYEMISPERRDSK